MKIKVLQCPPFAKLYQSKTIGCGIMDHYESITPIFNRDGFYLDRETKKCWIEYDGKAWTAQHLYEDFIHEIIILECRSFTCSEIEAIKTLISFGSATPELIHTMMLYLEIRQLNNNFWRSTKRVRLLIKRIQDHADKNI